MPFAVIDSITTRYEVVGSGPPLLMYLPGGFDATLEKWSTLGVYARIKLMDHLHRKYSCILFDRRETGQSGGRVEHVTWAHYVAQGKGLLEHLKIERALPAFSTSRRSAGSPRDPWSSSGPASAGFWLSAA